MEAHKSCATFVKNHPVLGGNPFFLFQEILRLRCCYSDPYGITTKGCGYVLFTHAEGSVGCKGDGVKMDTCASTPHHHAPSADGGVTMIESRSSDGRILDTTLTP